MLERIKSVFDVENVGFKIHEFPLNLIEPRLVIQTHTPSASKLAFNRNLMRFITGVKGHLAHGTEVFREVSGFRPYPLIPQHVTLGTTADEGWGSVETLDEVSRKFLAQQILEKGEGGRIAMETDFPFLGLETIMDYLKEWKKFAAEHKIPLELLPHVPIWLLE